MLEIAFTAYCLLRAEKQVRTCNGMGVIEVKVIAFVFFRQKPTHCEALDSEESYLNLEKSPD